jgi:DNA-binding GntR family transcriptional regulator
MDGTSASASRAYSELRDRIMTWQLPPGTALRETELAEQLGVSRTPVREALQRLRLDGLVVARGRRGVEVPTWERDELDEVYRLRANLEAWGAGLAAQRTHRLDLPMLHGYADEMTALSREATPDLDRIAQLNVDFHQAITNGVGSERLVRMLSNVVHLPLLFRVFHLFTPEQIDITLQEHHTMLMAFEAGDAQWAESLARAHILGALAVLIGPGGVVVPEEAS